MDHEGESEGEGSSESSLERIKRQLSCGAGSALLQGPLLKRSDTIRRWNWRWFALNVSTGKFAYWSQRGDASPKGVVKFDAFSTVAVSSINMMKELKYDGCCFYITTSQKKEYLFCAETPEAAKAWVATLRAAVLVLKAHREAASLLSGNEHGNLGNVATVAAAANVTAWEAAKDLQRSMTAVAVSSSVSQKKLILAADIVDDSSDLMRETLRVKDEELHQLVSDLKSRDLTVRELADRLNETADAAESAASAVHAVDKECKEALSEVDNLRKHLLQAVQQIRDIDAQTVAALKLEETAIQEAQRCRLELGKLRERGVILEAATVRVEDDIRKLKVVHEKELSELLQPRPSRMEGTTPVQNTLTDRILQERNTSEASTNVESRVDLTIQQALVDQSDMASASHAPASEPSRKETCEDLASELATESFLLFLDDSAANAINQEKGDVASEKLICGGAPCTDDASLSQTNHDACTASVSTAEPDIADLIQGDGKACSQLRTLGDNKSIINANDCNDLASKALVTKDEIEDEDKSSHDRNEIEIASMEEVIHAVINTHELQRSLEPSDVEKVMIKQEQCKREAYFRLCCF